MDSVDDQQILDASLELAEELLRSAQRARSRPRRRREARLRRVLRDEAGTKIVFGLADRVLRPVSASTAAGALRAIAAQRLEGFSRLDRAMLRLAAATSRIDPRIVVALVSTRIRRETRPFVAALEPRRLRRSLRAFRNEDKRPNVNVLGEAILGWQEAQRRTDTVADLLVRADVDCVSVKISSIAPGLSLVDFEGSVARASEPLRRLYRLALAAHPNKLVNLDMEEHRDLDLTVALFTRTLAEAEFAELTAGIALQAYLPDTHEALDRLLEFATERRTAGAAPIRLRLVKGANLAMERVEAELHGWPTPVYPSKADTDASYKALLERLVAARAAGLVEVGVASHNLFDLALALVLATRSGTSVEIEMLAGMADDQAEVLARRLGSLLLYVPVTARRNFRDALAYLARRLEENATPEGFLRHLFELSPTNATWAEQSRRFADAYRARDRVERLPRQRQDRTEAVAVKPRTAFANEPDTDLSVAANRRFAAGALRAPRREPPARAGVTEVDAAVARAVHGAVSWRDVPASARRNLLYGAADEMARGRGAAIASMVAETGKTFEEADPEVSEAIDYARWYASSTELLEALDETTSSEPLGVVVVAPPWNFPYAIPAGGVLAALAAGNTVLLKPSPEASATGALLVEQLRAAGFAPECIQLVPAADDEAGRRLISHPAVDCVVLTGSLDTAQLFAAWAPHRRLLAETSGKNALLISASADVDLAVRDLVRSAFGHAGQKCSAASLAIVEASIYDHSSFLRQLADATRSLRVGAAADPATQVGPIVGPMTASLERALTSLEPGEEWLVEPTARGARLYSPGVRIGVRPGSWTHRTEWFGPVLGVMRAADLDEAMRWQNEVDFGLTAGLHSLDPAEHERWLEQVEAGNCYLNRHTTGAIVGRQPFGGWKHSSVGPTAKAGGPNYLLGLRRFCDRAAVDAVTAVASYERAFAAHFADPVELSGLACESNELRYRSYPPGVSVRLGPGALPSDLAKAAAAASITATPVRFSAARPLEAPEGVALHLESAEAFAATIESGGHCRLRLLGEVEPGVAEAAAARALTVLDEPICSEGRVELVRWLREQAISRSLHRYGSVVYPRLDWGGFGVKRTPA